MLCGALFARAVNTELNGGNVDRPACRLLRTFAALIRPRRLFRSRGNALALLRPLTPRGYRGGADFRPVKRACALRGGSAGSDKARQQGEEGEHNARHRVV
jgi:hypothetical protein